MPGPLPIDEECVLYTDVPRSPEARRHLVRRFLADRLGSGLHEVMLSATPAGQPVVEGHEGLAVSWSHRAGVLLIGMARRRVGVDLEVADCVFPADEVVATFFSKKERWAFHRLVPDARLQAFYLLWTLREAYLKALGQGFDSPLGHELDFSTLLRDGTVPGEVARTIHGPRLARGRMLSRLVSHKGRRLRVAKITGM